MAREEAVALCYDWMLEFICCDMLQKFKSGCDIDQGILDFSNGMIFMQKCQNEYIKCKEVMFLVLISTLMSLKKSIGNKEEDDAPQAADFQNILQIVSSLTASCKSDDDSLDDISARACMETLLQRILACCRQDQFATAKELFEENAGLLNKELSRKVQVILHGKDKSHPLLAVDENPLKDYLSTMMEYLDSVYCTFPDQPLMMKVAQYYLTKGADYNGTKRSHHAFSEFCEEDGEMCVEELGRKDGQEAFHKLKAIRNRKLKRAALCAENRNSSHDLESEDGASEDDSQSDRSRKQRAREEDERDDRPRKQRAREEDERESRKQQTHRPDVRHRSSQHQDVNRREREQREPSDRQSHRSDSSGQTVSDMSADEQHSSETDDGYCNTSLQRRVPLERKPYHMRKSLDLGKDRLHGRHRNTMRNKWTEREEEEFYLAVQQYGVGEWRTIRSKLRTGRSNVQLKDKWRTILTSSYKHLCKKFGPVPH